MDRKGFLTMVVQVGLASGGGESFSQGKKVLAYKSGHIIYFFTYHYNYGILCE
jgi:hypothetical protein